MDCDSTSNRSLQEEEIQVMSSIYGSEWQKEDTNSYSIRVSSSSGDKVYFKVILPENYPLNSPPHYVISENIGESILYKLVIKIQDFIEGHLCKDYSVDSKNLEDFTSKMSLNRSSQLLDLNLPHCIEKLPTITHGEIIQDRKSVFQGHVAKVVSVDQAKSILSKLKENTKIANAKHNILAYRISWSAKSFNQDCDDDGEAKAGPILLHLLELLDVKDVVVIVTRWYGGIHLGADRFKHINNAARKALLAAGFIQKAKGCENKKKSR